MSRLLSIFAISALACAPGLDDDLVRGNQSPFAALTAPVIAPLGPGPNCVTDTDCNAPSGPAAPTGCSVDVECLPANACEPASRHCRVRFDASESFDPDNDPLTYVFQWGDGSEALHSTNPVVFHDFAREAIVTVTVRAIDIHGEESVAAQDVSIRDEYPADPFFCDDTTTCVVGDICVRGVCYTTGGTLH
ncbi:MAG: hypothetical protein A2289_17410 [Deltaproteobacteria bacterium RIFOXYA12_FULL_58_15]|nr:MAG: hypothetical protein A2289_17410 [Deltaproteobacteria bacterium RIFOXYA12_FULL_58_15]